jgi:DNA polymerase IV
VTAPRPPGAPEAAILHVDMDAFFAAVELLRRPDLVGRPVVVGGTGDRGVVAAASYEARAFGIHSAMPAARARRLCPHAVFLPGDHAHYAEVSRRVMELFRAVTPLVEPISLDEAFLDVSGARRLLGPAPEIAARLRRDVLAAEGLHCGVGVAPVKFLAKLASQAAKPRATRQGVQPGPGVVVVAPGEELTFLHPLPVQALWGVGPVTHTKLQRLGVRTVGDLAALPADVLETALGRSHGAHLHALAHGIDPRVVQPDQDAKSVGHEETFARDHHRHETLRIELLRLADAVASRLRRGGRSGRTITVKVRFGDFRTITRSVTLGAATDSAREIDRAARGLLAGVDPSPGVRLLGLSVSGLDDGAAGEQLSFDDLGDHPPADWTAAEAAVDAIRARYGARAVGPASLTGADGLRIARTGAQQWGPGDPSGPADRDESP